MSREQQLPIDAELFEYGLHTEQSDIRAHVSVVNKTIYVFPTRNAVETVRRIQPPVRPAYQKGVVGRTAEGWLVRVADIPDLRKRQFLSWEGWTQFRQDLDTARKGQLAVLCVIACMKRGYFPIWFDASEDDRANVQILGTDILVFCRKKIQVKCDYHGGDKPAGTGHLFLQRAERNPLKRR
jgi:hypothetical protein